MNDQLEYLTRSDLERGNAEDYLQDKSFLWIIFKTGIYVKDMVKW